MPEHTESERAPGLMTKRAMSLDAPDAFRTDISAVCISRNPEFFSIRGLPYHNYTEGWKPFGHEKTTERVSYLAGRRNSAVAEALALFPETKHVLMIDSYYLQQEE
jgi:hypothetical protein